MKHRNAAPFSLPSFDLTLILGLGETGLACAQWCLLSEDRFLAFDDRANLSEKLPLAIAPFCRTGVDFSQPELFLNEVLTPSQHSAEKIAVMVSPGLSPQRLQKIVKLAKKQGWSVIGELDIFWQGIAKLNQISLRSRHARSSDSSTLSPSTTLSHPSQSPDSTHLLYRPLVLAITGTNGKTTTTLLTTHLLQSAGVDALAAGNVSPSLCQALINCVVQNLRPTVWVLELSSFQLYDHMRSTHDDGSQDGLINDGGAWNFDAATILNISQDHLDWHVDMTDYARAKWRIFGSDTHKVLPKNDESYQLFLDALTRHNTSLSWVDAKNALISSAEDNWTVITKREENGEKTYLHHAGTDLIATDEMSLTGWFNWQNALSALALIHAVLPKLQTPEGETLKGDTFESDTMLWSRCLAGLRTYVSAAHRCQKINTVSGIEFIDDSKGTNVGATQVAIDVFGQIVQKRDAKLWLILGGDGKGQDFSPLLSLFLFPVGGIALVGKDAPELGNLFAAHIAKHALTDSQNLPSIWHTQNVTNAVSTLAAQAMAGDVVLLSPACASLDQFRDYRQRGQVFCGAVAAFAQGVRT